MRNPLYLRMGLIAIAIAALAISVSIGQVGVVRADTFTPAGVNTTFGPPTPSTIPAGGTIQLNIGIYNPNSFALILSTSPAALSDTLPAGVFFASPSNASNTCGGIVSITGTTISLYGGSVPAQVGTTQGQCVITVLVTSTVSGNHTNLIPAGSLVATDPTGTIPPASLSNQTPTSATFSVNLIQPPSLSKSFSPNTIWVGDNSTMTIRIINNEPNYPLTQTSLTDVLPSNITIVSFNPSQCGGTVSATTGIPNSITITGATIAAKPGECDITALVTSSIPDRYTNSIPANAIQTRQGVTNSNAASAPINVQEIGIIKSFSTSNFQAGGTDTLTITLQNPSTTPYTQAGFTDNFPTGVIVANPANASTTCAGGSVTANVNSGSVSISNGTIPAGTSSNPGKCYVYVNVTASTPANYTNTIPAGALTAYKGTNKVTNVLPASANVSVYSTGVGLSGSKSFSPTSISVGGNSQLSINITAPADTDLHSVSLMDALPTNVTVSNSTAASTSSCNYGSTPTLTATTGAGSISLTNGSIKAGTICRIHVYVTSTTPGFYTNTISPANISSLDNQGNPRDVSGNFSASLTVSGLSVSKSFYPAAVNNNGISTLTITLTNTNTSQIDNVSFSDTLPGNTTNGILVAPTPKISTTCGIDPNIITADAGTQTISMSGGTIPAQVGNVPGICTVNVDVIGKGAQAQYTNRIPAPGAIPGWVSGTIHGTTTIVTNPTQATALIDVRPITIGVVKSFAYPGNVSGGSSDTLSITLTGDPNASLSNITFTDNLPQTTGGGMMVANPPNLSVGTCGGTITTNPGDTSFKFTGGSLQANTSCTLSLSIAMNVQNNLTNIIGIGDVTTSNGAANTQAAPASLVNLGGLTVTKAFGPNPILTGGISQLTITITNLSNFPLTGVGLLNASGDTFPAGLTAITPITNPQCGNGTVSWDSANNRLNFSGGSVAALASCDIVVDVTAQNIGSYKNCILKNTMTSDQVIQNSTDECDTLIVNAPVLPPTISKSFSPASIPAGGTSGLSFTITNPNTDLIKGALTGISFADTLPANLTLASVPNASQCNGSVSYDNITNVITLTGGALAANSSCTVVASVTGTVGGDYNNTTGAVTSKEGGTGSTSNTAKLTVVQPPSISKSFSPSTIISGGTSTLTFTISNPSVNTVALTGVGFTDTFPAGITVAAPVTASQCGGNVTASVGAGTITLSSGTVPAVSLLPPSFGTCTVSVDVTASGGDYTNTSDVVTSTNGGTGNTASAPLTVTGPGLLLAKSTTNAGFQSGGTITYNYVLTNTGNTTLDGNGASGEFTVTDDKATVTCPLAITSLAPNGTPLESVTCTAAYAVQPADGTARSVTNTAIAHALSGGTPVDSNQDSVTVQLESLAIHKSTTSTGYQAAGATIPYSYTVTNTGNVTLFGTDITGKFAISDDLIGTFTCGTVTSLAPGANTTCTANYTVPAGPPNSVTNTATAAARDANGVAIASNNSSVTVYKIIAPTIAKTFDPAQIPVGAASTLTFTVTNPTSNVIPLTGVSFSDTFPAGMTVAFAPDPAQCGGSVTAPVAGSSISFSGGTVLANSTCTISVYVTAAAGGSYDNTSGKISSTNGGTGATSNKATLTVVAPPSIHKAFSPTAILAGGTSTLTFTLTNPSGNTVPLTGVGFTDSLPVNVEVANPPGITTNSNCGVPDFSPSASAGDKTLTFSGATLAIGGTCTISVNVLATSAGTFNNITSAVISNEGGTGATSNTATLTANAAADLSITKTDGKLAVDRGESVTYTIVVHNAGPSDVNGAAVSDTIPSSLAGAAWTCTADSGASCAASGSGNINDTSVNISVGKNVTYTVSGTVLAGATSDIINSVTVIPPSTVTDSDLSNNSATDIDQLNRLSIAKGVNPSTYSTTGTTINYSYTITNDGTSTLTAPITVVDDKVTPTCSTPVSLAPAASFTCTASHLITQADLDAGSITNSVSASGRDADGDTVTSNTDAKTVTATQTTGLTLAKSIASGSPYSKVGDVVHYSYLLTNTGNVTLIGNGTGNIFTVTDDKVTVTCPAAPTSLAPTETITCSADYIVTQADLDGGSVVNHANGHALFGTTPVTSNQDTKTAAAQQTTGLTLAKSITSGDPYSKVGDVVHYSYLLTNSGNVTLAGSGTGNVFTVTDDKATVTCPVTPTSLAPTQTITCTASYTVVSADLGSSVTNHATGHALFGSTTVNSNQDTRTATGAPVLTVTKDDGLNIVAPGATTEYTITVRNNSLQDATGIQLVDTIPTGTGFVSTTNSGTYDNSTRQITWPAFDLAAGASTQFKVSVQVDDIAQLQSAEITSVTNAVDVKDDGTHSNGIPVQAQATDIDQIATSNVKTLTGTEQAGSVDPKVLIGEILDYSIRIDIPAGTINDLQAVDILDPGLAFVGCDPTTPISAGSLVLARNPCTDPTALTVQAEPVTDVDPVSVNAGRHITFDFGQVQNTSGTIQTLVVQYRVIVLDIGGNHNGVTGLNNNVQWKWEGGTLSGAASGVNIVEPQLAIVKTVDTPITDPGNTVTYTIKIDHTSSSSAPAYEVLMTDPIPTGLVLDEASVVVDGSAGLPTPAITTSPTQLNVYWSSFPLGESATITFKALFVGPPPVVNTANVEWSSILIDPAPHLKPLSSYNQHSTERRYDPLDQTLNDYIASSVTSLTVPELPVTGFAPDQVTYLPPQTEDKAYRSLGDFWLEIPRLGTKLQIVGVPVNNGQWDLTWLGDQAGYLYGTAYPTHPGNSFITAHVYLPDGQPGPFLDLQTLQWGDQVIVHLGNAKYIYQVRSEKTIYANDRSIFKHEELSWLTLITCKDYNANTKTYAYRVAVRAVLIQVTADTPASSSGR